MDTGHMPHEGDRFGNWIIERTLDRGGMGMVYLAYNPGLGRNEKVALKVLDPAVANRDPDFVKRFYQEAAIAFKTHSPNLVSIHDAGRDAASGFYYIVMEYLGGGSLRDRMKREGPMPWREALPIVRQVAVALSAVARRKSVHRDIKPENIMFTEDGVVKLADFGIAKAAQDDVETMLETMPAQVFGTPAYMSPEQVRDSSSVDARADIWSLGVVLFEMLAGVRPYPSASLVEVATYLLSDRPFPNIRTFAGTATQTSRRFTSLTLKTRRATEPGVTCATTALEHPENPGLSVPTERLRDIPEELAALLKRMCEKNLRKRIASSEEVIAAIDKILGHIGQGGVGTGRRLRAVALAGLALALVAVGTLTFLWHETQVREQKTLEEKVERARKELAEKERKERERKAQEEKAQEEKVQKERERKAQEEKERLQELARKEQEEKARKAQEEQARKDRERKELEAKAKLEELARKEQEEQAQKERERKTQEEKERLQELARKEQEEKAQKDLEHKPQREIAETEHAQPESVLVEPAKSESEEKERQVRERQNLLARLKNGSEFVPNPPVRPAGARKSVKLPDGHYMAFRWCPPGRFLMGSPENEECRDGGERQHLVTLTRGFWIGETEVTRDEWEALMGKKDTHWMFASLLGSDGKYPMDNVSWDQVCEFCRRLGKSLKCVMRLPTEAEWEYACRAGTSTPFSFGIDLNGDKACCAGATSPYGTVSSVGANDYSGTRLVTSFQRNPWGIYDMHGNLSEWCSDWYDLYPSGDATDPKGPSCGSVRVVRGGCWMEGAKFCRAACRGRKTPYVKNDQTGFRVCLEEDGSDAK